MFEPKRLRLYKTDGVVQSFHYGRTIVSMAHDEERIYVSVNRPLPNEITDGLLAWFGMDLSRKVARYRCVDNSRYFVQGAA